MSEYTQLSLPIRYSLNWLRKPLKSSSYVSALRLIGCGLVLGFSLSMLTGCGVTLGAGANSQKDPSPTPTPTPTNPAPTVSSVSPQSGSTAGGTPVTISGSNFLSGATVTFAGVAATSVSVVNSSTITAVAPAHASGQASVTVTNPDGQMASGSFTYVASQPANPAPTVSSITPQSGSTNGGTAVTISGTNFLSGATVSFDTSAATSVSVTNGSTITAVTPPHAVGEANVTVKNPDGQSASLAGIINPVPNPGFESGATNWILAGVGGAANVQNNAANAHSGNGYVELSTSVAGNHPVLYSANAGNTSQYYPVNSGDIITFGGWGYHVSGNGNARWGIEVSDANKAHAVYVSAAPYNVTTSSWVNFQSSYTVPSGMAFIRFYCEINTSTGPSVDRFDDAFLQRTMPGGGFTYLVTSNPAPTLSSINPQSGGTAGGTSVTISGSNFISGASVTFDGIAATSVNFSSASTITAVTPPHAAGVANVTVTNPDGQSATLTGTISPLSNVGFESGAVNWVLSGSGGAAAIQNNAANAHSGNEYVQLSTSVAGNHPVMYAANANNVPQYFSVQPGDVITFGGWGYHVSGDGKARWGIEVSDANKANAVYVAASPFNVNTASWLNFQSSYTVPSGMAFVRFYCEITGTTGPAVDRFDDALLQIVTPSGGFTYVASSGGPPAIGSLSATQGISTGGDTITITGSGFATGATVTFGSTPATTTTVVSSTQIRVVTPASTPGSADVTVTNPDGQSSSLMSLLHNQSFESGISYWGTAGSGGTRTVGATTANAHIGTRYLEMASTGGSSHPVEYASTAAGASLYFPVTASQVVTFGGYAYRVSGGSQVRFGLEITDANKANATYVSAPPYSAWDPLWTLEQGTYTVPAGKSFVRLYAEVSVGTTATVGRFDDAFLQVGSGNSSGFLFFPPPIVTSVSPNWGAPAGGTTRTIYGTGFRAGATVSFGNLAASNVQVVNANAIEVFAPAASAGSVSVKVQQGSATGSLQNAYSYAVPPAPPASMLALKHIIFTLEENRSFDNYFSKMNEYRQMNRVNDNAVDERNDAIALPDIAGNPVTPYHAQTACQENLSPSWNSEHFDYDDGKMDNFLKAGNQIGFSTFDPNGTRAISYYDWTDLPYYYNLAFLFATSDKWFSPLLGSTDPNRMYYVGATSLGWTAGPHPPTGGFPNFTIFDLLDQAGISWKYYYQFAAPLHLPYWAIYQRDGSKVVPITQYFEDVKSESTLPAVVFIEEGEYNEHPEPNPGTNGQTQSVQQGAAIIKSFVDALMQSPTWKTSAFIVSYDEGGGFHDHVVPPAALAPDGIPPILTIGQDASGLFNQLGLRVPVIVVSPWTPAHLVSHVVRDHTAVLKLIETRFSLPPLTARDAASDNMSEFFNFASPPYMTPPTVSAQPTSEACNLSIEASPNQ